MSPSLLLGSGNDDLDKDNCTVCDSVDFDEEDVDKEIVQMGCNGSSSVAGSDYPTDTPSQVSSGYVGIQYNPQQ